MFAVFAALPPAFAATAFSLLLVCIEIGFFLAAIVLLPLLLLWNIPAALLLLERRIILKRIRKTEPQTMETAR